MTISRVAVYIGGASLLVAWLSSADSVSRRQIPPAAPVPESAEPVETLAADLRADVTRLRERLATPPRPQVPLRNPFAFRRLGPLDAPGGDVPWETLDLPAAATEAHEPDLDLIGFAEQRLPEGTVRTAMIVGAGDELIMVVAGDLLLQRYTVDAVGTESVELTDTTTGRPRRLVLP